MNSDSTSTPFVSIIVPVYNDVARIGLCIEALLVQSYSRERYEVLVVDNGSTDGTQAAVQRYPVTLLTETHIRGSYAARNKGLEHAKGAIIAFTDSDCIPVPGWIAAGVDALQRGADLAAGKVRFVFSERPTGAELFDSLSNLKMEQTVRERHAATTANLFAQANVFATVGPFPADMASGGDIYWTQQATGQGFCIRYAPDAEVAHPTRRLVDLLKKQYRVGRGHWHIRNKRRTSTIPSEKGASTSVAPRRKGLTHKVAATLRGLGPAPLAQVRESLVRHNLQGSFIQLLRVWGVAWLCHIATTLGSLSMAVSRKKVSAVQISSPASASDRLS